MSEPPLRVFLSYATRDRLTVRQVHTRLAQVEHLKPWFDDKILLPGPEWDEEISRAVRATHAILVCLSPHSVNVRGTLDRDIVYALNVAARKPEGQPRIFLLKLEACEVPPPLDSYPVAHWVEKSGFDHLVALLHDYRDTIPRSVWEKEQQAAAASPPPPPPDQQPVVPPAPPADGAAGGDGQQQTKDGSRGQEAPQNRPGGQDGQRGASSSRRRRAPASRQKQAGATDGGSPPENQPQPPSLVDRTVGAGVGVGTAESRRRSAPPPPPTETAPESSPLDYRMVIGAFLVVVVAIVLVWKVVPTRSSGEQEGTMGQNPVEPVGEENDGEPMVPPTLQDATETSTATSLPSPPPLLSPSPSDMVVNHSRITPLAAMTVTATLALLNNLDNVTPTEVVTPTPTATLTPTPTATMPPIPTPTITPTVVVTPTETPPPPEPTVPPPPPPPPPRTYTVQEGDTVRGIAQEWNVSVEDLLRWNNLTPEEADAIRPGQELIVSP